MPGSQFSRTPGARAFARAGPSFPSAKYPHPFVRLPVRTVTSVASPKRMANQSDERITEVVEREQSRLRRFIRHRLPDPADAEDILQDVFYELAEANRLLVPIEHVTAWLFRVARNRITDFFRRKRPEPGRASTEDEEPPPWEDLLPSPQAGPEAVLARRLLLEEIESALAELPPEQRYVFVAHELEGKSFKQMASETGVSVNTLLSRKHYAVRHLRERLQSVHDEWAED